MTPAIDRVDWSDPLSYVREMYGVPARVGMRVLVDGHDGEIVGGNGQYVVVKSPDYAQPIHCHPTWRMEYVNA